MTYEELLALFHMTKHPEGGAFVESYRSPLAVNAPGFSGPRCASTGIYFLLRAGEFSAFHRIKSDEIWHFYLGDPLRVLEITEDGALEETLLGQDLKAGQSLQHVVKAGRWFASLPAAQSAYSFVGCTVAPGFEFLDFELADREQLTALHPKHAALIAELTPARRE